MHFPSSLKPSDPQGADLLSLERSRSSFDTNEATQFLFGPEYMERQKRLLPLLTQEPLFDKSQRYFSSRPQRLEHAFKKERRLLEIAAKENWSDEDLEMAEYLIDEPGPLALHRTMFIPTLANQGTEAQKEKFLKPARNHQIIGCYAQTELGHGSNLQGLETTATYDPSTKEFIIHSPYLTASKWWIGGLGLAATHAVVMARLITEGRELGPHPFVVPIRSLKDHKPLPGVSVGDVGPKYGFNSVDNGWILFDKVRIPHDHMLARYAAVNPDTGAYSKPPSSKLAYGTMVLIRANIVRSMGFYLARATTIATRYSAIRRQFSDPTNPYPIQLEDGGVAETPVIEYTMQQYRLFPLVAQAYALILTGRRMYTEYLEFMQRLNEGDLSMLAEVHAASSGLKSLTSTLALDGIEVCRRACGGHGYSAFSGLPHFYADVLPNVTWEGDNYLLTQQTGRYLLKTYARAVKAKEEEGGTGSSPTLQYMKSYLQDRRASWPVSQSKDLLDPEVQLLAFSTRAARLVERTAVRLSKGRTWNDELIEVARISRAHCQYILVRNFILSFQDPSCPSSLKPTFKLLSDLFALWTLEQELGDLLQDGYVTSDQATLLRQTVRSLLNRMRPEAVSLVDAFSLPDFLLNSALGRSDGRVYEGMTSMAEMAPENSEDVTEHYHSSLRPLLAGSVIRSTSKSAKL
ncbi:MAG: acyl-CoA dehydrogenase/oxidase [Piptocephalis tieghemiana]|nr:MAG: acyl-CoA dehydrogenase/oxidase [Piptocephalis tieghemiana]